MLQLKTLVLPALSLVASVAASNVIDLTPKNFDSVALSGTPALVEFFAPWCGHCKRLAPIYEELADSFASSSKKVAIAKVDGDEYKDLSVKYGINGFPTIKYFDGTSKEPVNYEGARDLDSIQNYITEQTSVRPKKAPQAPSEVAHYDDSTFSTAVGKDKDVFVAFTAPWCGHCKTLAPTWEKLAMDYSPDDSIVIAKVDAEANKAVATANGVSSYPTIKYFPKGSTDGESYSGGRDEKALLDFVNKKAGLHRTVGGGLDITAGTIASLDTIAQTLTGSNLADVSAQIKKSANGLKDQYAAYYVKVVEKLADNNKYVEKESGRLEGLLKKGGLARPKEDDLTTRLNILKKFLAGEVDSDSKSEL